MPNALGTKRGTTPGKQTRTKDRKNEREKQRNKKIKTTTNVTNKQQRERRKNKQRNNTKHLNINRQYDRQAHVKFSRRLVSTSSCASPMNTILDMKYLIPGTLYVRRVNLNPSWHLRVQSQRRCNERRLLFDPFGAQAEKKSK